MPAASPARRAGACSARACVCRSEHSASPGCTSGACATEGRGRPDAARGAVRRAGSAPETAASPAPSRWSSRDGSCREKRVPAFVDALARIPELHGEIYGDGPDRPAVLSAIVKRGLQGRVVGPGVRGARRARRGARDGAVFRTCRPSAKGTGSSSSRPSRRGCRQSWLTGRRTPRPSSSRRASTVLLASSVGGPAPPRSYASATPVRRFAIRRSSGFGATADRLSLERSLQRVLRGVLERRFVARNRLPCSFVPREPRGVVRPALRRRSLLVRINEEPLDRRCDGARLVRIEQQRRPVRDFSEGAAV